MMEGGSIDVNGAGIVLTTEQCLLNENRNHILIEGHRRISREYLGVDGSLKSGIEGDDTDGHVDDFARFVSEDTVVCAFSLEQPQLRGARTSLEILRNFRTKDGRSLKVLQRPCPPDTFAG